MEGLVNRWWEGGKGGLSCSWVGGKGGRVKEVAVIEVLLFFLLWWVLYEQSLYGDVLCREVGLQLCVEFL